MERRLPAGWKPALRCGKIANDTFTYTSITRGKMALRCSGIVKCFGHIRALAGADLFVRGGAIHALLGENGAGKSTLNNVISGALKPDAGTLEIDGRSVAFASPLEAAAAGVGMVHQHFLLAGALTVAENIALGVRSSKFGLRFDAHAGAARVSELAERTGLSVDPNARVSELSVGMRQRVEILKALSRGAKVLLLDEPTAVLAPAEIERLFATLRVLRDEGRTIVIVTHKLDEVFALAGEVTVLRKGATVYAGKIGDLTRAELARAMIGQDPPPLINSAIIGGSDAGAQHIQELKSAPARRDVVLKIRGAFVRSGGTPPAVAFARDLAGKSAAAPHALDVPRLEVRAGEIVGVAGVEGNGQNELAALIAGTLESTARVELQSFCGVDLRPLSIAERSDNGMAFIPSDRHREGLVLEMSLAENLFLRKPPERRVAVRLLNRAEMKSRGRVLLEEFGVAPSEPELSARALSGGNQQKTVAARELSRAPKLILACNPTRGLDVGAAA